MFVTEVNIMVELFSSFTTTFFFLVGLAALGIIFEKQLIALEDKFDAWVASKRSSKKSAAPVKQIKRSTPSAVRINKSAPAKNDKYGGFAA